MYPHHGLELVADLGRALTRVKRDRTEDDQVKAKGYG